MDELISLRNTLDDSREYSFTVLQERADELIVSIDRVSETTGVTATERAANIEDFEEDLMAYDEALGHARTACE